MNASPSFDEECFLIFPIGAGGSVVRHRADGVQNYIVRPALSGIGLTPVRADEISRPGSITLQVIEHVLNAKAAIADLSEANANVFYELAIRHTARLPVVLIAHRDYRGKLPFDIAQMRTIFYDHRDLKSAAECQSAITSQLEAALSGGAAESPVAASSHLAHLQVGSSLERLTAQLMSAVENLSVQSRMMTPRPSHDLDTEGAAVRRAAASRLNDSIVALGWRLATSDDAELMRLFRALTVNALLMQVPDIDDPTEIIRLEKEILDLRVEGVEPGEHAGDDADDTRSDE